MCLISWVFCISVSYQTDYWMAWHETRYFRPQVTAQSAFLDEMFKSEWHYMKEIVKKGTVTGTTTGQSNYNFLRTDTKTKVCGTLQCILFLKRKLEKENQTRLIISNSFLFLTGAQVVGFKEWDWNGSIPEQLSSVPPSIRGAVEGTGQTPICLRLLRLQEGSGEVWNTLRVRGKPRGLPQNLGQGWFRNYKVHRWRFISY